MINKYYDRLNDMLKKDYKQVVKECSGIFKQNYEAYDVLTYLNDYIYALSDTVCNDYFLALCELEDYYMNIYKIESILNELTED